MRIEHQITALLAGLLFVPVVPALAAECQLACRDDGGCTIRSADPTASAPKHLRFSPYTACETIVTTGPVELRYRHRGRLFVPPMKLAATQSLKPIFEQFPADACGNNSRLCLQQRMSSMVAATGGHGIDGQPAKPGGTGEPCTMGLPCGRLMPPPDAWRFALADRMFSGQWMVRLARGRPPVGQSTETIARVDGGHVTADGRWFVAGSQYIYSLADTAGRVVATGEFSLISLSMLEALRGIVARNTGEGAGEPIAWIDALTRNSLEWDANQRLSDEGAPR